MIPVFAPKSRMQERIKTARVFLAACSDSRRIFCWGAAYALLQVAWPLGEIENPWLAMCYVIFDVSLFLLYWTKSMVRLDI